MLLVLDNLEHLIDGARGLVTDILSAAPDVRVVATSREALRLSAERLYDVPPLTLPDDDAETLDAAGRGAAVRGPRPRSRPSVQPQRREGSSGAADRSVR